MTERKQPNGIEQGQSTAQTPAESSGLTEQTRIPRKSIARPLLTVTAAVVIGGSAAWWGASRLLPKHDASSSGSSVKQGQIKEKATATPSEATGTPKPSDAITKTPSGISKQDNINNIEVLKIEGIELAGIPLKVNPENVDTAKDQFKNSIGAGTEMAIAEPGGLYTDQETLRFGNENEVASQNVPEGSFALLSLGGGKLETKDSQGKTVSINLPFQEGTNYFVIIRGIYPDGKQNTDENRTLGISGFKSGHVKTLTYSAEGKEINVAFISEGQFGQMVQASHSTGTNCGADGCSILKVIILDLNTKAVTIAKQEQGRFANPAEGWKSIYSNWQNVKSEK